MLRNQYRFNRFDKLCSIHHTILITIDRTLFDIIKNSSNQINLLKLYKLFT